MAESKRSKAPPDQSDNTRDPVDLKLDAHNPRFAAYGDAKRRKKEVIAYLLDTADLRELVESIAANGYLDFEPLVVWAEDDDGKLTVIEGNRRVAAMMLLRDPELAAELQVTLPPVKPSLKSTLERATIRKVATREDARQYIGFKHINGPQKWDSFAKGTFAADWYRAERKQGTTIRDIARRLGDRHDTILRLVNGIFVLDQAKEQHLFDIADRQQGRTFFFSHLYVALTRDPYREYLGLAAGWRNVEPEVKPVPKSHFEKLRQVLQWLFGSDSDHLASVIQSQNPDVKHLGEVLAHPVALKRLETTRDLREAHQEVATRGKKFEESLIRALQHAEDAQKHIDAFDGDSALLENAVVLERIARSLLRSMQGASQESSKG